ncbi:4865_t:CDS:2 [Funneliformis mosseae]|uniref:4865_t:CDS:1 n=1 Tax=Funneliformis mosseae TaxID=27381 RepID=A0A9N9DUH8_FUNMO|nr:4865_t:CDS:2 [Funneliformis mosseae]
MSNNKVHDFFKRKPAEWSFIGTIPVKYRLVLRNLRVIINREGGNRKEKIQLLNKYYSKAIEPQANVGTQGTESYHKLARKWEAERSRKPTFMEIGSASGTVNNGTISGTYSLADCTVQFICIPKFSSKRTNENEDDHEELQNKRTRMDGENSQQIFQRENISELFISYRSKVLQMGQATGLSIAIDYREILRLSHILLLQADNFSDLQIQEFSRDTLERLQKKHA